MRKFLWFPAILGIGLFFRNQGKVSDLIDTGDWNRALIYIAFGLGGAIFAILAMTGPKSGSKSELPSPETKEKEPKE